MAQEAQQGPRALFAEYLGVLSESLDAARDRFTYRAAGAAFALVVGSVGLALLMVWEQTRGRGLVESLFRGFVSGLFWLGFVLVVFTLVMAWISIAVSLRTLQGREGDGRGLMKAAAGRLPASVGAWLLFWAYVIALFLITWVLSRLAAIPVISVIVVVASVPILLAWVLISFFLLVGWPLFFSVAAAEPTAGPSRVLGKVVALVLARPIETVLLLLMAEGVLTAALLTGGLVVYVGTLGVSPIRDAMVDGGQTLSAALMVIAILWIAELLLSGPWAIRTAAIAEFTNRTAPTVELQAVIRRILGATRAQMRKAASVTSAAANAAKASVGDADSNTDPVVSRAGGATGPFCPSCGADNPTDYRFCRMCGTPAP